MAHEIFGQRFISARQPAWHGLGQVIQEEIGAIEALRRMGGEPTITVEPVFATIDGAQVPVEGQRAIIRHPTPDDPVYAAFGMVGAEYMPITAGDVSRVWDEFVAQPVETTGFLRRGSTFFITSKLPAIDIKGDDVDMYLGAVAPVDGARVASCEVWPVRVVCANTLRMAQAQASQVYRVVHDATARERMGTWLADMYGQAATTVALLKESFTLLANHRPSKQAVSRILQQTYPEPKVQRQDAPSEVLALREKRRLAHTERMKVFRTTARELWQGDGTGMQHRAAAGTLWGLYNAVVEVEDYRKGWNRDGQEDQIVGEGALFGWRARAKERAYDACVRVATNAAA